MADVKNQIKPLSEEMKELKSSVNQLLSIVRSMRNERGARAGEVRGSGRAGANERAGNEGEREGGGEEQREIAAGED